MANNKSARKRIKSHERNRLRNRIVRTKLRSHVKKFRAAVASGDAGAAAEALRTAHAVIDRTASKGVIHTGTANRYKSRLALAHQRMLGGSQG